ILVKMGEKVVAVALEVVADEIRVIAIRNEADALGKERIFGRDLLQPGRPGRARDLSQAGKLVDQFARTGAAQREREANAERQPVHHRDERKPGEGRGEGAAENEDYRL